MVVGAHGIGNGMHPRSGPPYVLLCDRVTYPPHPSPTTVVVPPSLLVMCRPISPESFRLVLSRRLTFAPGGRLVRVLAIVHALLPPAVDCPAGFKCLPALSSPSLPPAPSSECWRCRPRALALIALLAPGRQPALLAPNSFEVPSLRYLRPLSVLERGYFPRDGVSAGAHCLWGGPGGFSGPHPRGQRDASRQGECCRCRDGSVRTVTRPTSGRCLPRLRCFAASLRHAVWA